MAGILSHRVAMGFSTLLNCLSSKSLQICIEILVGQGFAEKTKASGYLHYPPLIYSLYIRISSPAFARPFDL
jgi:hypothetical protein